MKSRNEICFIPYSISRLSDTSLCSLPTSTYLTLTSSQIMRIKVLKEYQVNRSGAGNRLEANYERVEYSGFVFNERQIPLFFPNLYVSAEGLEDAVIGLKTACPYSNQKLAVCLFPNIHFDSKVCNGQSSASARFYRKKKKKSNFPIISKLDNTSVNL